MSEENRTFEGMYFWTTNECNPDVGKISVVYDEGWLLCDYLDDATGQRKRFTQLHKIEDASEWKLFDNFEQLEEYRING